MKTLLTIFVVAMLIAIVGCNQQPAAPSQPTGAVVADEPAQKSPAAAKTAAKSYTAPQTSIVEVSRSGFSPETIIIQAGDAVEFDSVEGTHWVASDKHPTHTAYPGSDINKCHSPEASSLFDACKRIDKSDSYSFTFTEKGSWDYHDHINPRLTGTVIVE